ncbi:ABC transporter permease [Chitinophaga filiformis]|uniref:Putative ABC transport system permease protein n=1 Tax=Chitinophaga filiformis TaxID=104663 RepID=A0A1G8E6R1_CHIFI|nr:ABC transporter permease [Chitinophaga filiformis]SDH65390.1 putative ABC transport system permease protein [Chitinophaga filiformis]
MLKNYLKIAWRNLLRKKAYSAINITGLAIGITCCILIMFYVQDELSYDRYNVNYDQIYRVTHAYRNAKDVDRNSAPAPENYQVWGNAPVAPALAADFPEIKKITRFTSPNTFLLEHGDRRFQQEGLVFSDSSVFDIFSWKLLAGNPKQALVAPNSVVLTKSLAEKYFGNENPLGQSLRVDNQETFTVTGVMEDVPANSHMSFNGLISMSTFRKWRPEIFDEWGYIDFYTYFLIPEHTNIKTLEAKIPAFATRHYPQGRNDIYTIAFEPLSAAYLHSKATRQPGPTGSLSNVYIFSIIAIFVLLIACINFVNLSTARSMERAREVGVRKAVGAYQRGLIYQFLTESILISFSAVLLSILFTILALPAIREISGKPLTYSLLLSWKVTPVFVLMPFLLGLLAGSYPAWVLSRFKPVEVLKGQFRSSYKGIALRKGLVIVQFSLSIALIAGTMIVYTQLKHLRSHALGFRQDQMLVIDYGGDQKVNESFETVKSMLAKNPAVQAITASRAVPGDFYPNGTTFIESRNGDMKSETPAMYEIDYDFIPAYEMKMAAGRPYSRDFPTDAEEALIINEAAAKQYGYANPEEIIGKRFEQWRRKGTVIGVVKDFNYQSLHKKVEPLAMRMAPLQSLNKLSLRIKTDHIQQTVKELEQTWSALAPQRPFLYSFLDQSFNQQYKQDDRFGQLFAAFAGLTIFIACLGLFGLATYATEQRVKEIGVRKVLGASVTNIVRLLSSDFIKLVLVAILIATPVIWWAMQEWLQGYAYRITIQWWMIALAGILAVTTALLTVSLLAVKAALMNPVKALRTE